MRIGAAITVDDPGITISSVGLIIHRRRPDMVDRLRDMADRRLDGVVLRRGMVALRPDMGSRLRNMGGRHREEVIRRQSMVASLWNTVVRHPDMDLGQRHKSMVGLRNSTVGLRNSRTGHRRKSMEHPRSSTGHPRSSMAGGSRSMVGEVAATRITSSTTRGNG